MSRMNLPKIVQDMDLNVQPYIDSMRKATDYLKGFEAKANSALTNLSGVTSAKAQFENLASAVAETARELVVSNKIAKDWASYWTGQIKVVQQAMSDLTTQAGMLNRLQTWTLHRGTAAPQNEVVRAARSSVAAQREAAAIQDRYWMEQAAKTRFGVGYVGMMPFGRASTRGVGPSGLGGSYVTGSPMLPISPYQYGNGGQFVGPQYPFESGPSTIQGPFRGAGPPPGMGGGFGTPGALPGGMSFLGNGLAVAGTTFAVVAAGAYLAKKALDTVVDAASRLGSIALQGVQSLAHGLEFLAQKGMEVERLETTFGVLLKSVQAGKDEFKALQAISIVTPYSIESLSDASQILLGMGVDAGHLNGLLLQMGDIAAGDTGRLRRLAVVFGEVAAEGKLTGWRIRQLASLGVGIADMAKVMGVPTESFRALVSANLVGSDVLAKTLEKLTSEGERFFRMNESQLEKTFGQWHRFENVVSVVLSNIGKRFLEGAGIDEGLARMSNLINDMLPTFERFGTYVGKAFYAITSQFANLKYAIASSLGGKGAGDTFLDMLPSPEQLGQWTKVAIELFIDLGKAIAKFTTTVVYDLEQIQIGFEKLFNTGKQLKDSPASPISSKPSGLLGGFSPSQMWDSYGVRIPGAATVGMLMSGNASTNLAIDVWASKLKTLFQSAPAQSMNAYRGSIGSRGYTVPNPFKLSPSAQALLGELEVEQFGGKDKGGSGGGKALKGHTALKEFSRAMQSIEEIESKGRWGNLANAVGTFTAGFGAAAVAGYGAAVNDSAMAYFTERNVRAGKGFMQMLPDLTNVSQDIIDEKKYENFLKLRQAVGGTISDHLPTAALYGSAEAVDTINKTNVDNRSVMDEMLSVAQAALDSDHQRAELQRQFIMALKELPPEIAKIFQGRGI